MPESGSAARRYHEATKHSAVSIRSGPHFLDWDNQPTPLKIYADLPPEPLPKSVEPGSVPALSAILGSVASRLGEGPPDRAVLARILHYSLGILRRRELAGGRWHAFRAAACTGALYHVDAYVACGNLRDLSAGVYHFAPEDLALRRLRGGDHRGALSEASGGEPAVAEAPAVLVLASTYWRNAWKYRARAWRHVFWDGGTILAQLLAEAAAAGWPARLVLGFADAPVERLLGLDPRREGVIALVPLGRGAPAPAAKGAQPLSLRTRPLSASEIDYPEIREAHAASSLADGRAAKAWTKLGPSAAPAPRASALITLPEPKQLRDDPLETVILRRGSSRRFRRAPISKQALSVLLAAASAPLAADYRSSPDSSLVDLFVIALAVEDLEPGCYRWHPRRRGLEQLSGRADRREAGYLALGQALGADAAVNVYAIADLDRVLGALGDRGYRAAQLDGGIAGGRTYLAAYALGLGATGLTFFDDDVARHFGLDPKQWGVMFLTAAGAPAKPLL